MVTIFEIIGMLTGLCALALAGFALFKARALEGEARTLMNRAATLQNTETDPRAVRDVAILHYDALEEMSGARSFSLALLNGRGDGVVVTSINGRTESRTYAHELVRGEAEYLLSTEEYRVIRAARLGGGVGGPAPREPEADATPSVIPAARSGAEQEPGRGE